MGKEMISNQLLKAADAIVADRDSERDSRLVHQAIAVAKGGNPEGIHFLYARFSPDVLHYVQSFVRDHHEAEDITQNVFAKLTTAIKKYEQREVPFAAWILRVARNAALDQMRAKRAIPTEEVRIADVGTFAGERRFGERHPPRPGSASRRPARGAGPQAHHRPLSH